MAVNIASIIQRSVDGMPVVDTNAVKGGVHTLASFSTVLLNAMETYIRHTGTIINHNGTYYMYTHATLTADAEWGNLANWLQIATLTDAGNTISNAAVDSNGDLLITLSNSGTPINAGAVTGSDGVDGIPPTVTVGTPSTGNAGTDVLVTDTTPSSPNVDLQFTIPRGDPGTNGAPATVDSWNINDIAAGSAATIDNTGTSTNAILTLNIPRGADGTAATLAMAAGTPVTTLHHTADATVTLGGSSTARTLAFGIPSGSQGIQGEAGPSGDITETTAVILASDAQPTVTLGGTSGARTMEFGIPSGSQGIQGEVGPRGNSLSNVSYNASTGALTITSDDEATWNINANIKGDVGDGFTGATYDSTTGIVTFTSDDFADITTDDIRGTGISVNGSATLSTIVGTSGVAGDVWIATDNSGAGIGSNAGDGIFYDGSNWINVGQLRGPRGIPGVVGTARTISVGTTVTGAANTAASVAPFTSGVNTEFTFTIPQGIQGEEGAIGPSGTITSATATVLAADAAPTVTLGGSSTARTMEFGIPSGSQGIQGEAGPIGPSGTIESATATDLTSDAAPTIGLGGTAEARTLAFGIPRGADGVTPTIVVGETATSAAGQDANVSNAGTDAAVDLRFTIPRGDQGPAGTITVDAVQTLNPGEVVSIINNGTAQAAALTIGIPQGVTGPPPDITIGSVTKLAENATPTANITGTTPNLVLNLGIPSGSTGPAGTSGTTLSIGLVDTLAPNTQATVTADNSSTPEHLVLNFEIPRGADGTSGGSNMLQSEITSGYTIGNIAEGAIFPAGTSFEHILRQLLIAPNTAAIGTLESFYAQNSNNAVVTDLQTIQYGASVDVDSIYWTQVFNATSGESGAVTRVYTLNTETGIDYPNLTQFLGPYTFPSEQSMFKAPATYANSSEGHEMYLNLEVGPRWGAPFMATVLTIIVSTPKYWGGYAADLNGSSTDGDFELLLDSIQSQEAEWDTVNLQVHQ